MKFYLIAGIEKALLNFGHTYPPNVVDKLCQSLLSSIST
jgi:hypothetical protein